MQTHPYVQDLPRDMHVRRCVMQDLTVVVLQEARGLALDGSKGPVAAAAELGAHFAAGCKIGAEF